MAKQPEPRPEATLEEIQQAWAEAVAKTEPRQLAMARLMPLTPELRAHYACPAEIDCDHPECQP